MGFFDDVTPNSVANAQDGFKEFRIGDNDAFIKKVEEKHSESGNEMLVITFANDEGAEIRHFIVNGEFKQQKLKQLSFAFGIPMGSRNINEWYGKTGVVVCKRGKPNSNGNIYNQVSYLRPKMPSQPAHNRMPSNHSASQPSRPPMKPGYMTQQSDGHDADPFEDDIPF